MKTELFEVARDIYTSYGNMEKLKKLRQKETEMYLDMDISEIMQSREEMDAISDLKHIYYSENYELSNTKSFEDLLIRRVDNKLIDLTKLLNISGSDIIQLDKNFILVNANRNCYNMHVTDQVIRNIEAKFLYLVSKNPGMSEKEKNYIIRNLIFMDGMLEDKFSNGEGVKNIIDEENRLNIDNSEYSIAYVSSITKYLNSSITNLIYDVVDPKASNRKLKELYLRSLLVYLHSSEEEKLHDLFDECDLEENKKQHLKMLANNIKVDKKIMGIKR